MRFQVTLGDKNNSDSTMHLYGDLQSIFPSYVFLFFLSGGEKIHYCVLAEFNMLQLEILASSVSHGSINCVLLIHSKLLFKS